MNLFGKFISSPYIKALMLLMLGSAAVHMGILIYLAVRNADLHLLNYFSIIGVSQLCPNFLQDSLGDIASIGFTAGLYLAILVIILRYERSKK